MESSSIAKVKGPTRTDFASSFNVTRRRTNAPRR